MRTILCYGDSNTWGYIPGLGGRHAFEKRWPGVLQRILSTEYRIVEEGLNGRATVWDEPFRPGRSGLQMLRPLMESHAPLDQVVIMLGTNDVLHYSEVTAFDAARGAAVLVQTVLQSSSGPNQGVPRVLLVAPPACCGLSDEMKLFCHGRPEKSLDFGRHYKDVATQYGCGYLDAAQHVVASPLDGIHLDEASHERLGVVMAEQIRVMPWENC